MIIASISNEITDCINDFWTEMENYIKKDFLGIEAEQIMTIFIYAEFHLNKKMKVHFYLK